MRNGVPTDKPRIQGYVNPDVHKLFLEYQKEKGYSQSLALELLIKAYLGIDPEKMKVLKLWAAQEHRMIEQQAQCILEQAIEEWARCNLESDDY